MPPPAALRPKPRPWRRRRRGSRRCSSSSTAPRCSGDSLLELLEAEGPTSAWSRGDARRPTSPGRAGWVAQGAAARSIAVRGQPANLEEAALRGISAQLITPPELAEWVLGAPGLPPPSRRQRRLVAGAVRQVIEAIRAIEDDPATRRQRAGVAACITDAVNDVVFHRYLGQCLVLAHFLGQGPRPAGDGLRRARDLPRRASEQPPGRFSGARRAGRRAAPGVAGAGAAWCSLRGHAGAGLPGDAVVAGSVTDRAGAAGRR